MEASGRELPPDQLASVFAGFVRQVAAAGSKSNEVLRRVRDHLGVDVTRLPVTLEQFDTFEQPNLQLALDAYLARGGRDAELLGVIMENKRFHALGLSDLLTTRAQSLDVGSPDFVNFRLSDGRILACVQFGLYLIRFQDVRLVALVSGPSEGGDPRRQRLRLEVMAARPDGVPAFVDELRDLMNRHDVYRGNVITLSSSPLVMGPGPVTLIRFQPVPRIVREDVVLPGGVLEGIERHTIGFSEHAAQLLAAGRSLKRGILLHGLPGTGKTLTVMYLIGRMAGRTAILTTGRGLGLIETVAQLARRLAPSMVVLEDVDLVAEERTMPGFGARPILFELLNEMDGLRDDNDVIFVLTTNRPDILEPALAARPGRIDLVVELPLPDEEGRRRLLDVHARGLSLDAVDLGVLVDQTEGATPAFLKELMRKAALHALEAGSGTTVEHAHVLTALEELSAGGRLAERVLGFRPEPPGAAGRPGMHPGTPTGFPHIPGPPVIPGPS